MASNKSERKGLSPQATAVAAAISGLAAGLLANVARKALMQGMDATYGNWDEILKAQHEATRTIFEKLRETSEAQTTKPTMLLVQLKHALTKHALEEENIVYPAMRENGLTAEADRLNHDHGYVKQFLFQLAEMKPSDRAWLPKVEEFRTQLDEHVHEEETKLFPKLREKLGEEGNFHVTAAMNKEGFVAA